MDKQGITLTLSQEEQAAVKGMLDDQMNYWLNESGCPEEYKGSIKAGILLYDKMGDKGLAQSYQTAADRLFGKEAPEQTREESEPKKQTEAPKFRTKAEKEAKFDEIMQKFAEEFVHRMHGQAKLVAEGTIDIRADVSDYVELSDHDTERIFRSDDAELELQDIFDEHEDSQVEGVDIGDVVIDAYEGGLTEDEQTFLQEYLDEYEHGKNEVEAFYDRYELPVTYTWEHAPVRNQMIPVDILYEPEHPKDAPKPLRDYCKETMPAHDNGYYTLLAAKIPLKSLMELREAADREQRFYGIQNGTGTVTFPKGTLCGVHCFDTGCGNLEPLEQDVTLPLHAIRLHNDHVQLYPVGREWSLQKTYEFTGEALARGADITVHPMTEKELKKAAKMQKKQAAAAPAL